MAFVDDPNENEDTTGVAGSAPLGQGNVIQPSQSPEENSQEAASAGSAAIQSGDINKAQSQGLSSSKKSPRASSGMFTNIQKYVEKNRPQAQQMAGAVTGDISKQASEIRQASEAKQAQQSATLEANQQAIRDARLKATNAVNQIMSPQPEFTQPVASIDDFKKYRAGNIDGINQVQDLDLSKQKMRTDALAQLAGNAKTEQGRRNLLGQTFQKQGAYTRGMSGLDQIITSGDKNARESLIQGTQEAAGKLQEDVNKIGTIQSDLVGAQRNELGTFAGDIESLASNPYNTIYNEADARAKKFGALDIGSTISDADLAAAGLTREQVSNLYGLDPSTVLGSTGASAEQIARMGGLSQLLGQDAPQFQEFKTQDFLDQIAAQKALYEKDYTQGSTKVATDAINKSRGGMSNTYYNALMRELNSLYDTGISTSGDESGLGGWAARRIQGYTTDNAGNRVTYKDLYDKIRKEEEERVRNEYKYGKGLISEEGDKLSLAGPDLIKSGGTVRRS